MPLTITQENPETPDAIALITELDSYLIPLYPPESCHGYSPQQLARENVVFFIIRQDETPVACGAIKLLLNRHGEIKRVYVRPKFRGRGIGKMMIKHLEEYAKQHDTKLIQLESGVNQPEALALYERMGYKQTSAFESYVEDPLSMFYEKNI